MFIKNNREKRHKVGVFSVINVIFLLLVASICLFPFINIIAISFSTKSAAAAGEVFLWPKEFNIKSYQYVFRNMQFWQSVLISLKRVVLGIGVNMLLIVLTAYPLSKTKNEFRTRWMFVWFLFIPMIFNGGLIPTYMIVRETGLIDSIWALVLPNALPIFNAILMLNFFKTLPKELDDSAFIDGAGHWRILFQIYIPLTKAALATLTLFSFVEHWNSWFDGMIYMNKQELYPLQTYIRNITKIRDLSTMSQQEIMDYFYISDRTMQTAQIVISSVPVLMVYPFLQKYFVKGIVLGSVKG